MALLPFGEVGRGHMLLEMLHLLELGLLEGTHALEHFVPVNKGAIKLRTVDTHKLGLAANGQSASATHASAVNHNGVQADLAGNVVLLGGEVRELHHDGRANGKHFVNVLLLDKLLNTYGDHTFLAIRAVVGHDDYLVGTLAYLIF